MAVVTTESVVHGIIADRLGISEETITNDKNLVDDLGADTLDCIELIMTCEKEFGVAIPEEKEESIKTVQDLINVVKEIKGSN